MASDWPLWGGVHRNFVADAPKLTDVFPTTGPKKIWSRPLGDGYSAIAVEANILYTAYHNGSNDSVIAIDSNSGKTLWEFRYPNSFTSAYREAVGPGPYAMPQVVGDRVIAVSAKGKIHSLDKKTGRLVWSHDLLTEFHGTPVEYGYSSHALPYKDRLIVMAGGNGDAAIALRQSDGAVLWKSLQFANSYSSPLLIEVDGQQQVVMLAANSVSGVNPADGALLWSYEHKTPYGIAVSTPVWAPGNLLFVASAYGVGGRVLQLSQSGGKTNVKQLWYDPHLQLHFGTAILRDGYIYMSAGYNGPALMTAFEVKTGKIKWQQRGFAKAQLLWADGKIILTDEDGTLALCRATPDKFEVLSKAAILQNISWTPPTLAGTHLYVRDRKTIAAYDLGR